MASQERMFDDVLIETGIVVLSKTKSVEWISTGDAVVSRRKLKADGTLEPNAYEIFIDPQTCKELMNKNAEILRTMDEVQHGRLSNPTNVYLDAPRIVQVSVFNRSPKFGIHKLDESGKIMRCVGLNFSPEEFCELMKFFSHYPPPTSSEAPPQPLEAKFAVCRYAWNWKSNPSSTTTDALSYDDDQWRLTPEQCLNAAKINNPLGLTDVDITTKQEFFYINNDFVDAAVAQLIIQNIHEQKIQEGEASELLGDYIEDISGLDVVVYGSRAREEISLDEIYQVCIKAMTLSEKPSPVNMSTLIKIILQRGNHPDALEYLQSGTLQQNYMDLFSQIKNTFTLGPQLRLTYH